MPLIKPRTRGRQFVRYITRLERENNETLHAYAHFLGESTEYVVNQVIDTVLAKDKDFLAWRAEHSQPFAPRPSSRIRKRSLTRDAPHGVSASGGELNNDHGSTALGSARARGDDGCRGCWHLGSAHAPYSLSDVTRVTSAARSG